MGRAFSIGVIFATFARIRAVLLVFNLVVHHLAVFHYIWQVAQVFDSRSNNNSIGALTDRTDYLVVWTHLKICSIDYDATALLTLRWRLGKAATLHLESNW